MANSLPQPSAFTTKVLRDSLRAQAIMAFRLWAIAGAGAHFKVVEEPPEWVAMHPIQNRVNRKSAEGLMVLLSNLKDWVEGAEMELNPEFYDRIERGHALKRAKGDRAFQLALNSMVKDGKRAAKDTRNGMTPSQYRKAREAAAARLRKHL